MVGEEKTAPNALHPEPFFPFVTNFQPVPLLPLTLLFIGGLLLRLDILILSVNTPKVEFSIFIIE
jgi:hypothetical protein